MENASTETMKPYVNRIMVVLLGQLQLKKGTALTGHIEVEMAMLGTIGKLAKVAGEALQQYFEELVPLLVQTLAATPAKMKAN